MLVKVFTLRFNPATESFDDSAVGEFLADKEVCAIRDHFFKERERVKGYLRYMDDLLLFADDKPALHLLLAEIRRFLDERLRLELKEDATVLAPVGEGVPFLGFRIYPGLIRLNRRSLRRFHRRLREGECRYATGEIGLDELTDSVASLYAHVAHADTLTLRRRSVLNSTVKG